MTNQPENKPVELKQILEAVVFASPEPVKLSRLAQFLEVDLSQLKQVAKNLTEDYEMNERGIRLVEVAGGFQFVTAPASAPILREYFKKDKKVRLSRSALETLAIIVYNQPVTRPEIDAVRGVNSDGVLKTLLEKRLVDIAGRKDEPGKPLLYRTTDEFLKVFGLKSLKDLPDIKELEELVEMEEVMEETRVEDTTLEPDKSGDLDRAQSAPVGISQPAPDHREEEQ